MILVWLGTALWVVVIINAVCRRIAATLDRPLSDFDLYCSSIDRELDEIAARHHTYPAGNCDVITRPHTRLRARPRTRGDA